MTLSSDYPDCLPCPVRHGLTWKEAFCIWMAGAGAMVQAQNPHANQPVALPEATAAVEPAGDPTTQPATQFNEEALDAIAGDAALEALIDQVMALPVAADRDVATVVSLSPDAEMSIRHDVAANHLLTRGRTSPDRQRRTVTAWISIEHLNLLLRRVLTDHFPNLDAVQVAIAAPADSIVRADGTVATTHRPAVDLPGWRHVSARRRDLAEQACRDDALHRALDTIQRLRLGPQQTVEELLRDHPVFDQAVRERVKASLPSEIGHDATGLCIMAFRLERTDAIRLLARAAHDAELTVRVDFSRAQDSQLRAFWDIRAYGLLPPEHNEVIVRTEPTAQLPAGWPGGFLRAGARAEAPAGLKTDADRRAWAERIAMAEARRRLWLQLEALPWKEKTVGEFLASHPRGPRLAQSLEDLMIPTSPSASEQIADLSGTGLVVERQLHISLPLVAETLHAFGEK